MSNVTYGRGQVEWALWRAFTRRGGSSGPTPPAFRTRIKRLLEIDKDRDFSNWKVPPTAEFAFVCSPEKRGGEVAFAPVDAFCLAVALDLLDAGFKQSEVVFLMRYLRIDLEGWIARMLEGPDLSARRLPSVANYPNLPTMKHKGKTYADGRIFVVIKKFEITEALASPKLVNQVDPLFLEPVFCRGSEDLGRTLSETMPDHRRVVTVVELAATAQAICAFLEQAPEIRRGRPKS